NITDTLPSEVTFVSITSTQGSCSSTSTITCNLGALAEGASATMTLVVTPTTAGTLSNTASVSGNEADPDGTNNSATSSTTIDPDADGDGFSVREGDCNDSNAAVHPGATEICNSIDDNCNGQIDENVKLTFYRDADGDGFGNTADLTQACRAPTGYVADHS